ncbi:uncharacterized protein LOC135846290 [Planococcus citri]|uniref:uncharacterized protein LOC135846290 n=1 Tax=Planococcus citri TaxID=170843 RepID=UPI0031F83C87
MKTKEIIITDKSSSSDHMDVVDERSKNDQELMTTATLVISSVKYGVVAAEDDDDEDDVLVSKLKRAAAGKRLSNNNNNSNNIDIVYHRNNKNNRYNNAAAAFNDDYRYFGRTTKYYCNCGNGVVVGAGNLKKSSSPLLVKNNNSTNIYHREIDSILDANIDCVAAAAAAAATVYATKKTLMLNELLELNAVVAEEERSPSSVVQQQRYDMTRTTFVNRFVSEAASLSHQSQSNGCLVKKTTSNNNRSATSAGLVVENNRNANNSGGWSTSSSFTTTTSTRGGVVDSSSASIVVGGGGGGKGCNVITQQQQPNQSVCLNSSILLTDKRLVGLFRSVALYWFFCLNTVLAKGDHVFKRKLTSNAVSPLMNDGLNEQLLLQHTNTGITSCSLSSSQGNLQLQICCPDVVLAVTGVDQLNSENFLWNLTTTTTTKKASETDENHSGGGDLLSWADHSRTKLFNDLFEKVLRNLANNCGIFTAAKPPIIETSSNKHRFRRKTEDEDLLTRVKMENRNCLTEDHTLLPPTPPSSTSPSKPAKKYAKKVIGVRRKYIIDVMDYYYDEDRDHEDDDDDHDAEQEEEEYAAGRIYAATKGKSRLRRGARKTPNTAVVNRIIWKKRAVKNKQKSKRKLAASIAAGDQHRRVQQIIIECYESAAANGSGVGGGQGFRTDYVINDGYEEVIGASDMQTGSPTPPMAKTRAIIVEDDDIIDFDNYAENLKREVTLRQQRKRRQLSMQDAELPVIKIMEPSSSKCGGGAAVSGTRIFESSTEDELSGTGSTNSSLLLELEREVRVADKSSYFLPDGRYHSVNQKYPKYDLWCSPLLMEKVIPSSSSSVPEPAPMRASLSSRNQTANTGGSETGRIFKYAKPAATAPAPAVAASFKPYRLWESSFGPEDDLIPSFGASQRTHRRPTAGGAAAAATKTSKAPPSGRRPPFGGAAAKESSAAAHHHQSTYTLWGSPKIIDFLPGVGPSSNGSGTSSSSSSIHPNEGSYSSSRGTMSSSSISEAESSSMECDEYASDTFEVLRTTAGHKGRDAFNYHHQYQHQFSVRGGKFLNLKPIINGFVSFTDRGAFQYYKKPATAAPGATKATSTTMITLALRSSNSSRQSDGGRSVSDASTTTADASDDVEVSNIVPRSDYETQFHFKPIQPAFKVPTDTPALIERSASGTLWCNNQRLMVFKHELDEVSMQQQQQQQRPQPRSRSRASVHELDSFQPKFVVNANDVACQTEWIELNPFERLSSMSMDTASSFFAAAGSANEKKTSQDPPYASGAMFFYAWDEVFNFLNKPGLGNIGACEKFQFNV